MPETNHRVPSAVRRHLAKSASKLGQPGARLLAEWLAAEAIDTVFLVPGLQIDPLFRELLETPSLRCVIANHELAAGFMADGYARASFKIGVCIGIGACGTSNMIPAATTAQADGSPVLFVTGNVRRDSRRLGAFQDGWAAGTNDLGLFRQALRHAAPLNGATSLAAHLRAAGTRMRGPWGGPAHLAMPLDVQDGDGDARELVTHALLPRERPLNGSPAALAEAARRFSQARRPILWVGSRLVAPGAGDLLRRFAERHTIPVATTLSAKGLLPEDHPLSLGNFGFAGSQRANEALLSPDADLLLMLGADFNERDSLCWDRRLKPPHRAILRVDTGRSAHRNGLKADVRVQADAAAVLRQWIGKRGALPPPDARQARDRRQWIAALTTVPREYAPAAPARAGDGVPLDQVVTELRASLPPETILVVDAGLQRIFAGHYWLARRPHSFFSACALAPMGWAVAAAVGIKFAQPRRPVVVLTGDGSMRAHGVEVSTMARYGLPILVVVCNNGAYGSVLRRFTATPRAAEATRLPCVDWALFARSLGAEGLQAETRGSLRLLLRKHPQIQAVLRSTRRQPCVLDVRTPLSQPLPEPQAAPSSQA